MRRLPTITYDKDGTAHFDGVPERTWRPGRATPRRPAGFASRPAPRLQEVPPLRDTEAIRSS